MRLQILTPSARMYGSTSAATLRTVARSTPSSVAHCSSGAAIGRPKSGSRASHVRMPGSVVELTFGPSRLTATESVTAIRSCASADTKGELSSGDESGRVRPEVDGKHSDGASGGTGALHRLVPHAGRPHTERGRPDREQLRLREGHGEDRRR